MSLDFVVFLVSVTLFQAGNAALQPKSTVQAEGLEAVFQCQHPTDVGTIDWTLNGTHLRDIDTSDGSIRTEGRGSAIEVLIIRALAHYNETEIVCITYIREEEALRVERSAPANLLVQGPLEKVESLMAVSSPSSISVTWEQPFSLDITGVHPDIVYCVDVFRISPGVSSRDHIMASDCGLLDSLYNFTTAQPDPKDCFQFVVTPRSHVTGARNGTASVINGSFSFEKPQPLIMDDVIVEVEVDADETITAKIILRRNNAISGPRQPDNYEVTVNVVDEGNVSTCPVHVHEEIDNTTLTLNCKEIQSKELFKVNVSASNSAGYSLIVQDISLSTHYVQDINVTENEIVSDQIDIQCEFVVNSSKTLGYLAVVYSRDEANYLITENQHKGIVVNNLTGLDASEYSTLLYAITEEGLPLTQAAGFPKNVSLYKKREGGINHTQTVPYSYGVSVNVSHNEKGQQNKHHISCFFSDSSNSACVVVYWQNCSQPYDLVSINTTKLNRENNTAQGSIELRNTERGGYHLAVFAFSQHLQMMHGPPLANIYFASNSNNIMSTENDSAGVQKSHMKVYIAVIVIIVVLVTIAVIILLVVLLLQRQKYKKKSSRSET